MQLFLAEPVQPFLHFVELTLEFVHFTAGALRFFCWFRLPARKRRKHGECFFEHFHIPSYLVLKGTKSPDTEGLRYLFAKFTLFFR